MEDKNFKWVTCIQFLKNHVEIHNTVSSKNALEWLFEKIAKYPNQPPSNITPKKNGILIEFKKENYCCELLFENDSSVKRTDFFKNKVIEVCWV